MIAVDTNILVRYAVNDDPVQSQQAKALLKILNQFLLVKQRYWSLNGYSGRHIG